MLQRRFCGKPVATTAIAWLVLLSAPPGGGGVSRGVRHQSVQLARGKQNGAAARAALFQQSHTRVPKEASNREDTGIWVALGDALQWHGDVFGRAKDRDIGANFFLGTPSTDWAILIAAVLVLCLVDLLCLRHYVGRSMNANSAILFFWICCGIAFNIIIFFRWGRDAGFQWVNGYFLEWLLSMDNLFVFHLIFKVYGTPRAMLHKALFFGILGAVVFRMFFFIALASLLHLMHWFRFVFGILLIYSGVQVASDDGEEQDVSQSIVVRLLKKVLGSHLVEKYDLEEHRLFLTDESQGFRATLLVPVICCLELTDILFAVDSVSAKVAQIPNNYISYSSSVLALFGLRAMFFIINDLVDFFLLLKYGLCFILVFIGIQLMVEDYVKLSAQVVTTVILSIFLVCTVGSTANKMYKQGQMRNPDMEVVCETVQAETQRAAAAGGLA